MNEATFKAGLQMLLSAFDPPPPPPPPPPPAGSLQHPLASADITTPAAQRFIAWAKASTVSTYGFDGFRCALAAKLTGDASLASKALALCDSTYLADMALIAAGKLPSMTQDDYLYSGVRIQAYCYAMQWCSPSATQVANWSAYIKQTVWNLQNPTKATWQPLGSPNPTDTWNGWASMRPSNNYTYRQGLGLVCWAMYSQDATLLAYMNQTWWPAMVSYFQGLAGGGSTEGTGYGYAAINLFEDYLIWLASTGVDFSAQSTHCRDSLGYWVHATTPDGKYHTNIGDQSRESTGLEYDYYRMILQMAVVLNPSDPLATLARWWLTNTYTKDVSDFNCHWDMPPVSGVRLLPASTLWTAQGVGNFFMRSDWSDLAVFASLVAGLCDEGHLGQCQGSLDFWGAGGWLTNDQNSRTHSGIKQTTDFKNVVRFVKADGTLIPQKACKLAASCSDDGNVVTLSVALDTAYGVVGLAWTRTVIFNRSAKTVTIHDLCLVPAGVTAVLQLQTPVQPTVSGNVITAGHLTATVQTPAAPTIATLDWTTMGTDNLSGWRTDVSGGVEFLTMFSVT